MIRRPPRSTLFPTRRSSDLASMPKDKSTPTGRCPAVARSRQRSPVPAARSRTNEPGVSASRSEEHTSELQSRLHLVCRLLLEKKKKKKNKHKHHIMRIKEQC